MDDARSKTLLKLHEYYAQEARHQREMMWQTARWFVLILGVLFGVAFSNIVKPDQPDYGTAAWVLLIPIFSGYLISLVCILLTWSFYGTNLINISTFAKIEDELDFDRRAKISIFKKTRFFTWQDYRSSRQRKICSQDFVQNNLKVKLSQMHILIYAVFAIFALGFSVMTFLVLTKVNDLSWWVYVLALGIYFLPFLFSYLVLRKIRKGR